MRATFHPENTPPERIFSPRRAVIGPFRAIRRHKKNLPTGCREKYAFFRRGGRHAIRPQEQPGGTPDRLPFRTPGPAMPQDADADRLIDKAEIRKSVLVGIDIADTGTFEKRSPQGVGLPAHTRIV